MSQINISITAFVELKKCCRLIYRGSYKTRNGKNGTNQGARQLDFDSFYINSNCHTVASIALKLLLPLTGMLEVLAQKILFYASHVVQSGVKNPLSIV